jgi:hypothetical protein
VWALDATLTAFKIEDDPNTGDSDYHLARSQDEALPTGVSVVMLGAVVASGY